jgi:hypothetical protein
MLPSLAQLSVVSTAGRAPQSPKEYSNEWKNILNKSGVLAHLPPELIIKVLPWGI